MGMLFVYRLSEALLLGVSLLSWFLPFLSLCSLRGPGGITSRDASFNAFQEVQKEIQERVGELHEAVERQRRIFPCKQTLQDDCGKLIVLVRNFSISAFSVSFI